MRFTSQGVLYASGWWDHRVPHLRLALAVSDGTSRLLPDAVPGSFARTGSSSPCAPLQSASVSSPARALLLRRLLPWGSRSLIATSTSGVVAAGFPLPPPSVLGVSHALDGLIRLRSRGFISPHSHVQGSPERDVPSRTAGPSRRRPLPSRRWLKTATGSCPPAPRSRAPPSGLPSVRESVAPNDGV
jgi:hypothetical protein